MNHWLAAHVCKWTGAANTPDALEYVSHLCIWDIADMNALAADLLLQRCMGGRQDAVHDTSVCAA